MIKLRNLTIESTGLTTRILHFLIILTRLEIGQRCAARSRKRHHLKTVLWVCVYLP